MVLRTGQHLPTCPICHAPDQLQSQYSTTNLGKDSLVGDEKEYAVLDAARTFANEQLDREVIEDLGTVMP